jgi:hypothetical protein
MIVIDMLAVTLLAIQFVLVIWIINLLCRSTESQTRHSAVNLNKRNKIKPDVACSNQHALPRPVINDGFSTASGEDLNNQSFLRLKEEETNLIELENVWRKTFVRKTIGELVESSSIPTDRLPFQSETITHRVNYYQKQTRKTEKSNY